MPLCGVIACCHCLIVPLPRHCPGYARFRSTMAVVADDREIRSSEIELTISFPRSTKRHPTRVVHGGGCFRRYRGFGRVNATSTFFRKSRRRFSEESFWRVRSARLVAWFYLALRSSPQQVPRRKYSRSDLTLNISLKNLKKPLTNCALNISLKNLEKPLTNCACART